MKSDYIDGRDALFLALVAALPILGYQFGLGNQVEQFSIIRRLADPDFIPADFYVNSASSFGPRYYYAVFLSWLTRLAPLPLVVFVLSYLSNFALAAVTFDTASRQFKARKPGAAIAALLVIANSGFSLGLAGFIRFESFQPASLAIPFSLFGFAALMAGRTFIAAPAFAVSALFHPLIGVETAMIGYASCGLVQLGRSGLIRSVVKYAPSGLLFSAVLVVFWLLPSLRTSGQHISDAEFFAILPVFRAPHHYLAATFPLSHYFSAVMFVLAAAYLGWRRQREDSGEFGPAVAIVAASIVVGLCLASLVFVDVFHNRAWTTAQVFRDLYLLKWIGYLFFGWAAARWLDRPGALYVFAALVPVLAAGDAQPIAMMGSAALTVAVLTFARSWAARWVVLTLIAAVLVVVIAKFSVREESCRAAIGCAVLWLLYKTSWRPALARVAAVVLVLLSIGFGWINRNAGVIDMDVFKPTYAWSDVKGADVSLARWARVNTPADSVWVTPPDFERFRLLAERAIVVDFTSVPFEPLAMREWKQRMETLYGHVDGGGFKALRSMTRNYRTLSPVDLRERAGAYKAEYAVLYSDTKWPGAVLYRNDAFKVVKLTPES